MNFKSSFFTLSMKTFMFFKDSEVKSADYNYFLLIILAIKENKLTTVDCSVTNRVLTNILFFLYFLIKKYKLK